MTPKILVLTTTYPTFLPGDATPPFVHELSKRLVSQGSQIIVLAPRRPGTKTYEVQEGVHIYRYGYFFKASREKLADGGILPNIKKNKWLLFQIPFFLIACFMSIVRLVSKHKIQIIHSHWIITNGFLCAVYKKFINNNIKLTITSHGGDAFLSNGWMGAIAGFMRETAFKYTDQLTVVSAAIRKTLDPFIQKYHIPTHIAPMGVEHTLFTPANRDPALKETYNIHGPMLLFQGRLTEKKGIKYAIQAMPQVLQEFPGTKLVIVGGGPYREPLEQLSHKLHLQDHVIFAGPIPNKQSPAYFATADAFVGPSIIAGSGDSEGFGLVFVEALMSGTPVVATQVYGITDIVTHKQNGYLGEQKNSDSMAQGIIRSLKHPRDKDKLVAGVQQFSRDNIAKQYYQLLCK